VRRLVGISLCIAGALTLSFAGGKYAIGAVRADEARAAWDRAQAHARVVSAFAAVRGAGHVGRTMLGAPVARVVAPSIGLDVIVLEGVEEDELNASPGPLPGSALPGEPGNAIISAHRDRHFRHLDRLDVGDTVVTEANMHQTRWVVVSKRVIARNAPALFHTPDATLTLTTCWPMTYIGPAPQRLIITAKPLRA
jgi:sortase A